MTNYNERGVTYSVTGDNSLLSVGGYMSDDMQLRKQSFVSTLYEIARNPAESEWVRKYLGAVHHLDGFLVCVERIVEQVDFIKNNALLPNPLPNYPRIFVKRDDDQSAFFAPPVLIGISSKLLEIELETALLRAVSLLERLTTLSSEECQLGKVGSFFRLEGALNNVRANDICCEDLYQLLGSVKADLENIVLSDGHNPMLRNIIAHRNSTPEIMDKGFSLNVIEPGVFLPFDVEVGTFPLVGTVWRLAKVIPFFALNFLRILLFRKRPSKLSSHYSNGNLFTLPQFQPTWQNPFLHYSSFVDPSGAGPLVSIVRWMPGGFQAHQQHLVPDVLNHATRVNP